MVLHISPGSRRTVSLRRGFAISFLDQSLLSLANFLIGVFLIRNIAKEQYGMYAIACAVVLFVVGIQNALVTTQMMVLAPRDAGEDRKRFCAALGSGQYLVLLPCAVAVVAATVTLETAGFLNADNVLLIFAVCAASVGVVFREFFRGYFFRLLRPSAVLAVDTFYLTVLGGGLAAFAIVAPNRLHVTAILLTGAASLLAGFAAMAGVRMKPVFDGREIIAALREVWQQGRWALAGVMVTWLQDQSYLYLLALLAGAAETADASAARLFLAPAALLNVGFGRILLPRWAAMNKSGEAVRIWPMARKSIVWMVAAILVYAAVLLRVQGTLVDFLAAREYRDLGVLVCLWCVVFVIQAIRSGFSWMLQATGRFAPIARANGISAVVVLLSGAALIGAFGARGSILALLAGEIVLALLLRRACRDVA